MFGKCLNKVQIVLLDVVVNSAVFVGAVSTWVVEKMTCTSCLFCAFFETEVDYFIAVPKELLLGDLNSVLCLQYMKDCETVSLYLT